MKISKTWLLTLPIILLSAFKCEHTKVEQKTESAKSRSKTDGNLIRLPIFDDPSDPRLIWLESATRPRIAEWSGQKSRCNKETHNLEVDFGKSGPTCSNFLPNPYSDFQLSCGENGLLIINTKATCNEEIKKHLLIQIRLPDTFGLYRNSKKHLWIPNESRNTEAKSLPSLEATRSNEGLKLKTPDLNSWLSSASTNGAVHIVLRLKNPADRSRDRWLIELKYFLERQKESSQFKLGLSLNNIAIPSNARFDIIKLPVVQIDSKYSEPLYTEACQYLGRWIRARQVLANMDMTGSQRLELDCFVQWFDEALQDPGLSITKLAVPLVLGDSSIFPFPSGEDSMSPYRFQPLNP